MIFIIKINDYASAIGLAETDFGVYFRFDDTTSKGFCVCMIVCVGLCGAVSEHWTATPELSAGLAGGDRSRLSPKGWKETSLLKIETPCDGLQFFKRTNHLPSKLTPT